MLRLLIVVFTIQAGYHGFTGALPVALASSGFGTSQIGLIVGSASIVLLVAAPIGGVLLDRIGPIRMLALGGGSYLAGALLLAAMPVAADAPLWPWLLARGLQGIGFAVVIPSALTLVPGVVPDARRGFWLTFTLLSQNLTLAILPAMSLAILRATSLSVVALAIIAMTAVGTALIAILPRPPRGRVPRSHADAPRRFGLAFRASWGRPLLVTLLAVAYWGLLMAHLPPRAEVAGTSAGLFFVGYGISVLLTRLPIGWLSDRYPPRFLVLSGLVTSLVSIGLLFGPLTHLTVAVSGGLSGAAAGLVTSPLLLELSRRSAVADRGSAFSLFAVATGGSNVIGSIGGGPIIEAFGFQAALVVAMVSVTVAGVITIADSSLRHRGSAT